MINLLITIFFYSVLVYCVFILYELFCIAYEITFKSSKSSFPNKVFAATGIYICVLLMAMVIAYLFQILDELQL